MADTPPVPRPRTRPRNGTRKPSDATTDSSGGIGGNSGEAAGPGPEAPPKAAPRSSVRAGTLEAKLNEFFGTAALGMSLSGDTFSAEVINVRGPEVAKAWADLAKVNPAVKRILESLTEGSAWGAVIVSSASMLLPILKHKGVYRGPDPFALAGGPVPPPREDRKMAWASRPASPPQNGSAAPATPPTDPTDPTDSGIPVYQEGGIPGVVTVAAHPTAAHPGAQG